MLKIGKKLFINVKNSKNSYKCEYYVRVLHSYFSKMIIEVWLKVLMLGFQPGVVVNSVGLVIVGSPVQAHNAAPFVNPKEW